MSMQCQLYSSPFQLYSPLSKFPPTSLTQDLPPGLDATVLLLGCGDARNILYTLFCEQDHQVPRGFDFTCCEIEPGIMARNVMLFTLLIDHCQSKTHRDLWDVYHSFFIDKTSHELIRNHAAKLRDISKSINTWNSNYGSYVRMVNVDTLESLHHMWSNYCDPANSTTAFRTRVKSAVKEIYDMIKDCENPDLTRACGAGCFGFEQLDPSGDYLRAAVGIWKRAVDSPANQYPNPLFVYSQGGGSRFCVDCEQCSYYGFHLVTAFSAISPDSPFHLNLGGKGIADRVEEVARNQFGLWCAAFCQLVRNSIKNCESNDDESNFDLRIRVFVGDALALVDGLKRHNSGSDLGVIYSRPYSSRPLSLIDDFGDPENAPSGFNVIDAGYLVDYVGFFNTVPGVIPLLRRVRDGASILYTSIQVNNVNEEQELLTRMLCGDVRVMSTLLGIVPIHYLSPHTPRFYHVDNPTNDRTQPVTNRIPWKLVASDCPKRKVAVVKEMIPHFDEEELAQFFKDVFFTMFYHEYFGDRSIKSGTIEGKPVLHRMPTYTKRTFTSLIRYVQSRVHFSNDEWATFIDILMKKITKRALETRHGETVDDFILQMIVSGVLSGNPDGILDQNQIQICSPYRNDRGVLKRRLPPEIIALVITIPRATLKRIYDVIAMRVNDELDISFEINRVAESRRVISCPQLIFGKLIPSKDGETGIIQEDRDGWHGTSDLHICTYITTVLALIDDPRKARISVRIRLEASTLEAFESMFGEKLEIFNKPMFDPEFLHYFVSLPGLKPPQSPYDLQVQVQCVHDAYAIENESFRIQHPRFSFRNFRFTLVVIYLDKNQRPRKNKSKISVTQNSPCTAILSYNDKTQSCIFPFPITDVKFEHCPASNRIIISASLVTPANTGFYNTTPFPVVRLFQTEFANWNYPYINFRQLPKIDATKNLAWLEPHVNFMLSEREMNHTRLDQVSLIKPSLRSLLLSSVKTLSISTRRAIRFTPQTGTPFYFFPTGLYHDLNSASIVLDAYVLSGTADIPYTEILVKDLQMKAWRSALPVMIERCRNWEHTSTCEYLSSSPLFCSCGMGIVEKDFVWDKYQSLATRIAVSPIFAASYVDQTRNLSEETLKRLEIGTPNASEKSKCKVCFKESSKKCSRCRSVSYCSRECQSKDWRQHKKECEPKLSS